MVVVVGAVVVASVVGATVVSGAFFSPLPHAATITADRRVTDANKSLLFVRASQIVVCYYFIMFQII